MISEDWQFISASTVHFKACFTGSDFTGNMRHLTHTHTNKQRLLHGTKPEEVAFSSTSNGPISFKSFSQWQVTQWVNTDGKITWALQWKETRSQWVSEVGEPFFWAHIDCTQWMAITHHLFSNEVCRAILGPQIHCSGVSWHVQSCRRFCW